MFYIWQVWYRLVDMKLQRFYVPEISVDKLLIKTVDKLLKSQLQNVFRLKTGDKLVLFDGFGYDFLVSVDKLGKSDITFKLIEKRENKVKPKRETYLFASIVKKDNFEWIVQKATELGVSSIFPIISDRSEKKALNIVI